MTFQRINFTFPFCKIIQLIYEIISIEFIEIKSLIVRSSFQLPPPYLFYNLRIKTPTHQILSHPFRIQVRFKNNCKLFSCLVLRKRNIHSWRTIGNWVKLGRGDEKYAILLNIQGDSLKEKLKVFDIFFIHCDCLFKNMLNY